AVALIVLHIGFVADPDAAGVEQPHDRRDDGVAAELALAKVGLDPLAQLRQRLAEVAAALVFRRLPAVAEIGMVAILLAALVVIAGRLDVAVRAGAEPGVAI